MFEKRQKFFTQARKKYKIKKRKEKSDSRREMGEDREMIERKEGISRISGNFVVYTMK